MKRLLALLCIVSLILVLAGCRKSTIETTSEIFIEKGETTVSVVEIEEGTDSNSDNSGTIDSDSNNDGSGNSGSTEGDIALTEEELRYMPSSLTVTYYDTLNLLYGFTFNTTEQPIESVIQIKKKGSSYWKDYPLKSEKTMYFDDEWSICYYYVSKAKVKLDADSTYIYRICDIGAEKKFGKYIGTEEVTLNTKNPNKSAFTFANVTDTQRGPLQFKNVLSKVADKVDFLLHTGDVIQNPIESDWIDMINGNFQYLSRVPMMAIAGNHEINGGFKNSDTYRHFNNNIPAQKSTESGYFYSFVYSNAKFIMLNTNDLTDNKLTAEQYDWLVNELKSKNSKWTIVSLHNPLYSVGEWGSTNNTIALALQEQLKGIFAEYGVDLVLQGHDHTISRTYPLNSEGTPATENFETLAGVEYSVDPKGVIYVTNGTSGSVTREPENYDISLFKYATGSNEATWSEITINDDKLTVVVKHFDNGKETVYYQWGIKKTS